MSELSTLRPPHPIATSRFVLRTVRADDLDGLHAIYRDEAVARYIYNAPLSRAETEARLERAAEQRMIDATHDSIYFVAAERNADPPFGVFTLAVSDRGNLQGEIGYMLNPDFQSRGYAVEAASELLRLGFEEVGFHRISASLDQRNTASATVAERLGMRLEAHFVENEFVKGEWVDEVVYAILRSQWRLR